MLGEAHAGLGTILAHISHTERTWHYTSNTQELRKPLSQCTRISYIGYESNSLPVTNRALKSLNPGNNFYYCCSRKVFKILSQKYSRIFCIRQDWKSRCLISGLKFFMQRDKKLSPRNRIKNQSIEMTKVRYTVASKQDNQDSFTDVLCVCTKVKKGLSLTGANEKDQHEMSVTSIWKDKVLSSTVIRLDARKCRSGRWQSGWNNQNETVRKKGNLNADSPR